VTTDTDRNYKVEFQRVGASVDDGYNTVPGEWATYCIEWADVRFSKGSERRQAAQEQAAAPATFVVPSNEKTRAISTTDRISFDGGYWDIVSNIASRQFNENREIEAVRAAD
jgi:head-tail adaptor